MNNTNHRRLATLGAASLTLALAACDSGTGTGPGVDPGDLRAAPAANPPFTINSRGGAGGQNGASGGSGGPIVIEGFGGPGSLVEVRAAGQVDAGFTPQTPTPVLGDTPLIVTGNTTVPLVTAEPAAGLPYLLANNSRVFVSDGDSVPGSETDGQVTGISVAAGATLTFGLNVDGGNSANVFVPLDVDNRGTITTLDAAGAVRGGLTLVMASYVGNGRVDTSGNSPGQSGAPLNLNAQFSIFNAGPVDSSGADAADGPGGAGGMAFLNAAYAIENGGDVDASGGLGTGANPGGSGALVQLLARRGGVSNSGILDASGGDGGAGGAAGAVVLVVEVIGDLRNAGDIDASGGTGNSGNGGAGGPIVQLGRGGDVLNSGELIATGGAANSTSGTGGPGGTIEVLNTTGSLQNQFCCGPPWEGNSPAGDLRVSGNLSTAGGSGGGPSNTGTGSGSNGQRILIANNVGEPIRSDNNPLARGQTLSLLGYSAFIAGGGGGGGTPGAGGDVSIVSSGGNDRAAPFRLAGGSVVNEAHIDARGGSASGTTAAFGGSGGRVTLRTDFEVVSSTSPRTVGNSGNIDASAGMSFLANNGGGSGNPIELLGSDGVTNAGNLTNDGADDPSTSRSGTSGYGLDGGPVRLLAETGPVDNGGTVSANGGDGEWQGGRGSFDVIVSGTRVTQGGNISVTGGDADPSLTGSRGGDGGYVELFSPAGVSGVSLTGTVSLDGGTGMNADEFDAIAGSLTSGGLCVSSPFGCGQAR